MPTSSDKLSVADVHTNNRDATELLETEDLFGAFLQGQLPVGFFCSQTAQPIF